MKIRAGFVSNSSSSSFVAYGFLIDNFKKQMEEKNKDNKDYNFYVEMRKIFNYDDDIKFLSGCEDGFNENETFFGVFIAEFDSDGENDIKKCDMKQLSEAAEKTRQIVKENFGLEIKQKPDIYSGIRLC